MKQQELFFCFLKQPNLKKKKATGISSTDTSTVPKYSK